MVRQSNNRDLLFVYVLFLCGIIFRMWFITLSPQPTIFDQKEYMDYAAKIFWDPWMLASHSYRSYPFPLMMAIIYKCTGWANVYSIYVAHAVLDSLVGVMVFMLLKHGFKSRWVHWAGLVLYQINPFTSGYVGVLLSEILATFFITATFLSGYWFMKKPTVLSGVLFGVCAGMAAETRNAAFIWAGIPIALTLMWISWKKHLVGYIGIGIGLVLTTIYPLITNWRTYKELSITKVDSFYAMEFFNGASLKILPPFTTAYPREQQEMWFEYWSEYYPGRTKEERAAIAKKYWNKGWDIVKADPVDYLRWRFFKMWYVWQKENFFFYKDPFWPTYKDQIWWGNAVLLMLAVVGMVAGSTYAKASVGKWIWGSLLGTIAYGMMAFSISHAEYRLSIPFYPVIIAFAGLGVIYIANRIPKGR